ncbi:MAG: hypothetical protein ACE147_07765 [Candidatus Methylomirabilales bacterium]
MRRLLGVLAALALLFSLAGAALADCGAGHSDTVSNPPEKPLPQS